MKKEKTVEKVEEKEEIKVKAKKKKEFTWWKEFKAFISRGSVMDLAVGVVIGGAFSTIVTAFTKILLSVCTWGVPGGLKGLVTVLPATNIVQAGLDPANGLGQMFASSDLQTLATELAQRTYGVDGATATVIEAMKTTIMGKYTLYGSSYVYNLSATIDWGTFINAIISFLIIAFTLFIILKAYKFVRKKRVEFEALIKEEYYKKHPEERPAPVEPGKPKPTEIELLTQIKDLLAEQKGNKIDEIKTKEK